MREGLKGPGNEQHFEVKENKNEVTCLRCSFDASRFFIIFVTLVYLFSAGPNWSSSSIITAQRIAMMRDYASFKYFSC